eukprot:gene13116-8962_t
MHAYSHNNNAFLQRTLNIHFHYEILTQQITTYWQIHPKYLCTGAISSLSKRNHSLHSKHHDSTYSCKVNLKLKATKNNRDVHVTRQSYTFIESQLQYIRIKRPQSNVQTHHMRKQIIIYAITHDYHRQFVITNL